MPASIDHQIRVFAENAMDLASAISLRYFRSLEVVETKPDNTPVTVADREVEQMLRDLIAKHYPDHGICGEEYSTTQSHSPWTWVIDPIDGTKSFATGNPTFGCLIALLHHGIPCLGIIDMPALHERWIGIGGQTSRFNGNTCKTSDKTDLAHATLYATTIDMFTQANLVAFESVSQLTQFRHFGGDCYAYGLLASGYVDLIMEADMKAHDYLALVPVVEGAGGYISDWQGHSLRLDSGGTVLASANQTLHEKALAIIDATQMQ
ncbi:MAG: histidinol phosphate phosphatase [Gammaproteobacteria bacterium]|nr:histidinol phosphate phosphatase [Gammaproteobacteria bacterium]